MKLESPVFEHEGNIPQKYTCDGEDVSPPIMWTEVPTNARTLALICDDPDAPQKDFSHWVVFNIPSGSGALPEHVAASQELADGTRQGKNDFGKLGWGGPCPPSGTHRYRFTLYAVDTELGIPASSSKNEVEGALKGHVIDTAQLRAAYTRAT
jgi:Raf kinase inhibitor-like YbhB/YbcL family protein